MSEDGYGVITENEVEIFNEEIGKKTRKEIKNIIMEIREEIDVLFKRKIKYLVNIKEKEHSYYSIKKVFKD